MQKGLSKCLGVNAGASFHPQSLPWKEGSLVSKEQELPRMIMSPGVHSRQGLRVQLCGNQAEECWLPGTDLEPGSG